MQGDTDSSSNLWRSWLQDHHNPEIYYPLKVLADAVPAVDQQYGFISVTRNSLVLSLGFLKGLRYALPLPLLRSCRSWSPGATIPISLKVQPKTRKQSPKL